jgi:hypothetical protein
LQCNGVEEEVDGGSPEEDNEPPSPCNIRFIGDNIVINGKSNLRKEPKQQKVSGWVDVSLQFYYYTMPVL